MKYPCFLFIGFWTAALAQAVPNPPQKKPAAPPVTSAQQAQEKKDAQAKAKAALALSKLADLIQSQYSKTTSATFSFEQSYKHPFLAAVNESSKGKVFFKPQHMLWRYTEPADRKKEFYLVGKNLTYYLAGDKLAYVNKCFEQDTLVASITFLWGKGKLKESFTIEPFVGKVPNEKLTWLRLIPKEKDPPAKSVSLGVNAKGVVMESSVVDQSDGVNHFKFSDFVINKDIPNKIFDFVPPAGVLVQPMPNVQCPIVPAPTPKAVTPAPKAPAKATPKKTAPKNKKAE